MALLSHQSGTSRIVAGDCLAERVLDSSPGDGDLGGPVTNL